MSATNPRQIAWELLNQAAHATSDELLDRALTSKNGLDARDRRLVTELFYGSLRRRATLDWFLHTGLQLREQKPEIQNLLCLALYQLFFLEKIPPHALVHEAVELAKPSGHGSFVNAVLRRSCREEPRLRRAFLAIAKTDPAAYYSHPPFLWKRWVTRFGEEQTRLLCDWNNQPPPLTIRVNTLRTSRERLINEINRSPVKIHPSASHPLVATLDGGSVSELGAFTRGEFYVQDESTLAAVDLLAPKKGERIADLCAAPGGKTTYAAQLMENKGQILACEVSEKRLKLVAENCARLGVTIVSTVCGDATRLADELEPASFDGVLVDAPCTNTGVLRRRVDARWRLRETDFSRLAVQQLSLLRSAATLVRPSGRLVYSTCSLETEENENVVNEFLRQSPGFRLEESRLLFPPQSGTDGGYIALLRKSP